MKIKIVLILLFSCATFSQTCSDFPEITTSTTSLCAGLSSTLSINYTPPTICNMNITPNTIPLSSPIPGFTYAGIFNGHYYYVYNTPTSWTQGELICRQNGGYLVCINDINENAFVSNSTNNNIWIGMYRDPITCNFRWLDCMNITFTNWRAGEPNSGPCGEPYVQIIRGCSFGLNSWNNLDNVSSNGSCYSNMVPIMEIDPAIYNSPINSSTTYLWSTGETTASISVTPGVTSTYWVDIITNSLTCRKSITINVGQSIPPTVNPLQSFCTIAFISDLVASGTNIKWYDAATGGNLLPATTALVNGSIYYASQTLNSCESSRVPVTVSINIPLTPTGTATQFFCNSATVADIAVTGVGINWYSSALGGTALATTTPLVNGTNYFASQTINGCTSQTRFLVLITINPLITPVFSSIPNQLCHNSVAPILPLVSNNTTPISGTWIPSVVNTSIVGNSSYLFTPNSGQCVSIIPVISTINVIPKVIPIFSDISFCKGKISPILTNTSPNGIGGMWTPAIINNNSSADYIFTPNVSECALPKTIHVNINEATLLSIEYLVSGDFTDNQTVTVIATNPGNYLYQLDSGSFQTSNIFQNVNPGIHFVKVVDVNGCSQDLTLQNVMVINYPRFFSPNGDSYNDHWNILGFLNTMKPKIFIYDRYGKLVKQIKSHELGWDGMYNGKELPATDYWFTAEYQDLNGNYQLFKSHFSLIR